jgi:hypothetical protein
MDDYTINQRGLIFKNSEEIMGDGMGSLKLAQSSSAIYSMVEAEKIITDKISGFE